MEESGKAVVTACADGKRYSNRLCGWRAVVTAYARAHVHASLYRTASRSSMSHELAQDDGKSVHFLFHSMCKVIA